MTAPVTADSAEARLKRMRMRAWRRGTKEMDLVLGPYADAHLAGMDVAGLDLFETVLAENDQDLMRWVIGQETPPEPLSGLLGDIAAHARARLQPG